MFKSAWDSTASWIWSECRDSRYSSTELRLPSSRQQDQDRDGDQDQDENEAQSSWHTPHRGGRRSIYPRSTSFPPLKVATISLSPLTPTSSATEKQQHQPKKPKPTISFSHLRSRSTNSVNLRPGSSTTRVDREALLRALSGQPIAQTVNLCRGASRRASALDAIHSNQGPDPAAAAAERSGQSEQRTRLRLRLRDQRCQHR